jgi:hypothetical protein
MHVGSGLQDVSWRNRVNAASLKVEQSPPVWNARIQAAGGRSGERH